MTAQHITHPQFEARLLGISFEQFRAAAVWLMMASSFFVIIEPAPVDLMFLVVVLLFLTSGLKVSPLVLPMILYLLLYNLGGFISFLEVSNESKAGMFVITSAYMAVSAIFFAFYVAHAPVRRIAAFKNGYVVGAVIASVIGLIGYFDVGGLGAILSPIQRAQGTFKDPNVLSTYLILPAIFLTQEIMLNSKGWKLPRYAALLIILACLFLAFSRGAWISFAAAAAMMITLTFVLTPSAGLRSRIILLTVAGCGVIALLVMYLLTIEEVRNLFLDRLTLVKSYDAGETGRFGIQMNSLQYMIEKPLGFGPTLFRKIFGQDPHNVYLNAFASYGWMGGISYFLLVGSTLAIGFKTLLIRTPWQDASIAVFCPLATTILQGIQIDTDHWRHFYWMLGLMWGLYAVSAAYALEQGRQHGLRRHSGPDN
ncbi:MAG: O-antigen ligase family protein [Alphaproteobacteria bacterium]|nr:O-antigen ligase family protein [Alphaproteobacteria bacterium]